MEEAKEFDEMVIRRVDAGLQIEYRWQGTIMVNTTYPALLDDGERVTIANVHGKYTNLAHKVP